MELSVVSKVISGSEVAKAIGGDGGLGGYRWGLHRKRTLIERERAVRAGSDAIAPDAGA